MSSDVWDAIAGRDLRGWSGLPPGVSYASFDARFPRFVDAEAVGRLGRTHEPAGYRVHVAEGYPDNLKAWFRGPTLVLVEAALPRLVHSVPDLMADLGDPADRLDDVWGVLTVPGGTRVYPGRGIAVFVGPEGQLLRVSLFAPVTLDEYLDRLRPTSELTERPLHGDETTP